jgi:NitT/TauT family transport system permease protein
MSAPAPSAANDAGLSGAAAGGVFSAAVRFLSLPTAAGLAGLIVFLVLIEIAVRTDFIPAIAVARPSDAIIGLFTLQKKVDLLGGFAATFGMTAIALLFELLVALPVGYFLYHRRDFGLAYEGWLAALFAAPVFLLFPLFMVAFGRGYLTLIIMGFIPGVIPLILQVVQGFIGIPRALINVGRSFGLTERQIFWNIMVPAATSNIFAGFRLALMYTLVNIIAVEYLVDLGGLGRIVSDRYFRFDIQGTYSSIIAVAMISITFNWAIGRAERWLRPA